MCAITGMPARTIRLICFALRSPPSHFTAWQPVSFMNRSAVASASSGPFSYEPNGMSAMTSARLTARTTARVSGISSSTVTGIVVSYPNTVLPAESPTSRKSMPASSKISADRQS